MSRRPSARLVRWLPTGPAGWLLLAVVVYFAVSLTLSWLRSVELQTSTWDMGLYQQALWSTAHGRPFYETADVETGGYGSLLQVHSTFLLFALAPLYRLWPSQLTLFVVQSALVAGAAVPLYLLGREVTGSTRLGLLAGVVYLAWTPTLSSNLYDFHAEAFLPIELFGLALLWEQERYRAGIALAFVAFVTFEFAPVLTFFVAVFGLLTARERGWLRSTGTPGVVRDPAGWARFRHWLLMPRVLASWALLLASVAAYGVLLYLRTDYLLSALGTYPLPAAASGYVIGVTPSALGLSFAYVGFAFSSKVTYWLLLVALLGFVPLLAPRALLLVAPWFAFTMLSANANYTTLGFQYGFLAGSALLIAFVYGLPEVRRLARTFLDAPEEPTSVRFRWRLTPRRRRAAALIVGVGALLALNVALTPLDPVMQETGLGSAYRVSYALPSGSADLRSLVGLIPPGATVVASDNLFPLVANDEAAYSFLWAPDPALGLPFDATHPPPYVLVAENSIGAVSSWLTSLLYNRAVYGVRGVDWSSAAGAVLLFEATYAGPVAEFGARPAPGGTYFGDSAVPINAGYTTTVPGSAFSTVVRSAPDTTGPVWNGPQSSLAPGKYSIMVSLRVTPIPGFPPPNATSGVVWVGATAFAVPSLYGWTWPYSGLNVTGWTTVEFNVTVDEPVIDFAVPGVLLDSSIGVTLNYLSVAPQ